MRTIRIIALCMCAAIAFGIIHDQVTARICVEYFTLGHPPIFKTQDPTLLGLGWGVLATWWVGLLLGIPLALVARIGARPPLSAASLVKPIFVLLCWMGAVALIAGITGYVAASKGMIILIEPLASSVPAERHSAFLAVGWAHGGSYLSGLAGGIVLIVITWRQRRRAVSDDPQLAVNA